MTETIKLFDTDAYLKTFTARVLSCEAAGKKYAVVLDRTAFFPEEGGQTADVGILKTPADEKNASAERDIAAENDDPSSLIHVMDVQTKDGLITHFCDAPLPAGTAVLGTIDWQHRYSNMQQHTGEHIFSGVVHRALGYDNVGFH